MENLCNYQQKYSLSFIKALDDFATVLFSDQSSGMESIFRYHLGLDDIQKLQGKRIRPLLLLLCAEGSGGDWESCLPAAVSVEMIHNFSLIHDDIEDNSDMRRSKQTVWAKWGLPIGLNAGDAMFSSAYLAVEPLRERYNAEVILDFYKLLGKTCFRLTLGQNLDIEFENRDSVTVSEYIEMISGKTAALIECCCQMGALLGGLGEVEQLIYGRFGFNLGIAFQIYDDWLGIWGDPEVTGKSSSSDLIEKKKSFPVLLGLQNSVQFRKKWVNKPVLPEETQEISQILRDDDVEKLTINEFHKWNQSAMRSLEHLNCGENEKNALKELSNQLLIRRK